MFKIFFVEDEAHIRDSIRETMDWNAVGFEYAGDAPDGESAVSAIRRVKPDIVITDIRMPFVDGLELTRIIRGEFPEIRIIILSGYNDFSYAQKAISLGVSEYLLKPISPVELVRALNKVALGMRSEGENGVSPEYRSIVIRKSFLRDLLKGTISPTEVISGIKEFDVSMEGRFYVAAAVKLEANGANLPEVFSEISDRHFSFIVEVERNEYGLVFQGEDDIEAEKHAVCLLARAKTKFVHQPDRRLYSGIGAAAERAHEISRSFREAETACNYAVFTSTPEPCLIKNVRNDIEALSASGLGLAECLGRARELMQCGDIGEISKYAREIKNLASQGAAIHYAYIDILMTAARTLREMEANSGEILPELSVMGAKAFAIDNPEALENAVKKICESVITYRVKYLTNRRHKLVADAKRFIDKNYPNAELSLQNVASEAHVSPTYFSAVFSRETGETFSDYLSRVRVTNAMKALRTTSLPAAEIAEMVGYNDPLYFSRVFKRAVGVSISEFRKGK
jgi:two-component system response regulator YesN